MDRLRWFAVWLSRMWRRISHHLNYLYFIAHRWTHCWKVRSIYKSFIRPLTVNVMGFFKKTPFNIQFNKHEKDPRSYLFCFGIFSSNFTTFVFTSYRSCVSRGTFLLHYVFDAVWWLHHASLLAASVTVVLQFISRISKSRKDQIAPPIDISQFESSQWQSFHSERLE